MGREIESSGSEWGVGGWRVPVCEVETDGSLRTVCCVQVFAVDGQLR